MSWIFSMCAFLIAIGEFIMHYSEKPQISVYFLDDVFGIFMMVWTGFYPFFFLSSFLIYRSDPDGIFLSIFAVILMSFITLIFLSMKKFEKGEKYYLEMNRENSKKYEGTEFQKFSVRTVYGKVDLYCGGDGTEKNPIIINQVNYLPLKFAITFSKKHLIIKNLDAYKIKLKFSENFEIRDCNLKKLKMMYCSKVKLVNTAVDGILKLKNSRNIMLEKCSYLIISQRNCRDISV